MRNLELHGISVFFMAKFELPTEDVLATMALAIVNALWGKKGYHLRSFYRGLPRTEEIKIVQNPLMMDL